MYRAVFLQCVATLVAALGAGKIQIEFGNLDQLEGILQRLR